MNANELANLLEVDSWYKLVTRQQIAAMLRQQQAEIEALKQIIDANNLSQNIGQFRKTLTDGIDLLEKYADKLEDERPNKGFSDVVYECIEILRKAQEK